MGQKLDQGLWGLALRLACALAEAWGGGQHPGRSLHELTRPLIQGRFQNALSGGACACVFVSGPSPQNTILSGGERPEGRG